MFGRPDPRMAPPPGPLPHVQLPPGFRPPGLMGGPPGMGMQQPMLDPMAGMGMLGMGLGMMGMPGANPNGMPEDEKLGGSVAGINALQPQADGTFAPPPMPTDIGYGQGGDGGGFFEWLKRNARGLF